MGRRISQLEAKQDAEKYLRLALALLDEASAFEAAIHASTALDVLSRSSQNASDMATCAEAFDHGDLESFSIEWGVLVDYHQAESISSGYSDG